MARVALLVVMTLVASPVAVAVAERSPLEDWAVQPGFSLEVDAVGFRIPTAIAFVPEPGTDPDAPLYFVTELRGGIKVVTNDRSVHTFATVPTVGFQTDELTGSSQQGLAGICLDPRRGYVFVTFTYPDASGVIRNNIVRFRTRPGTFALAPEETKDFRQIFADFQAAPAHQIGGCQVRGDSLFVGVGDGGNVAAAGNLDILLGKVLRLSVDGTPPRDNPFREADEPRGAGRPASYVWAYGFRNPFGLAIVGDEIFVAENGIRVDRVLKVERGASHHWDGTDQSIATGAIIVFPSAVAPVQLAALTEPPTFFPVEYADHFFFAAFGGRELEAGVITFGYDRRSARARGVPRYLLAHRGKAQQHVIGVAIGPDALYIVPARPDARGESVVLKMRHDPQNEHPVVIGTASDRRGDSPAGLLQRHGCISCHAVDGQGGGIGPSLDRFGLDYRLTERLNATGYEESLAALDLRDDEPFVTFRNARREVLAATGRQRTSVWLKHFLLEPRFDNPNATMPNPRLTEAQAEAIRNVLYGAPAPEGLTARLRASVLRNRRAVAFGFAGGVGASALLALAGGGVYVLRRRRRST